jgi:hypothetical protein
VSIGQLNRVPELLASLNVMNVTKKEPQLLSRKVLPLFPAPLLLSAVRTRLRVRRCALTSRMMNDDPVALKLPVVGVLDFLLI